MFLWFIHGDEINERVGLETAPHLIMIKIKENTDLVEKALMSNEYDVYVHGANCFCTMGAGIAGVIAKRIPIVYEIDKRSKLNPKQKLGKYTSVSMYNVFGHNITFINAYTQFTPGNTFDYQALEDALNSIKTSYGNLNLRFAFPWIGCGIGGGNKDRVRAIINKILSDEDVTILEL